LQLQHGSLTITVKMKVNSFQNCRSQQLHWTKQFFLPLCNILRASICHISRWIQVCIRNVSHAYFIFQKICTYADVCMLTYSILAHMYPGAMVVCDQSTRCHLQDAT